MFAVDRLILVAGLLLLIGIGSSKFSARVGLPVLVLFLVVGMLAGSEGLGGIAFDNYVLAHGIGTLALAVILFDGGLRTSMDAVRTTWKPALSLATVGVLVTAAVTGAAAAWILGIPILLGLLLGAIVGSTDAAAVFSVLRSSGVRLREKLANTLEIESASNDPMAIFLTVGLIEVLLGRTEPGLGLVTLFFQQMVIGAGVGVLAARATVAVVNRINIEAAGMYPLVVTASGLICFGITAALGGSGFLAVFIAGVVIGNSRMVFRRSILFFHDAAAWLSQIVMFTVLGLLSFPSRLLAVWWEGLLIALVLMLVARPIAVLLTATPFGYDRRELAMVSWVGLKGAVPITLATFPLMMGVPGADLVFDVVFFVVLLSALAQGSTLAYFARRLGLELPFTTSSPVSLEISSLKHIDCDIVDLTIGPSSPTVGRRIKELGMPSGGVIAMIAHGDEIIPPSGDTVLHAGDHAFVIMRPALREAVNRIFAAGPVSEATQLAPGTFPLHGDTRIRELRDFYDLAVEGSGDITIDELFHQRVPREGLIAGAVVEIEGARLVAHEVTTGGDVELVGLILDPHGNAASEDTDAPVADAAGDAVTAADDDTGQERT